MKRHGSFITVNGATDFEDAAHTAGVLAITEHPEAVDCDAHVQVQPKKYFRCPEPKYDLSRDQAWLLMVGLLKQYRLDLVRTEFINGKDLIYPSLKGIETIAKRGKPYFWQRWWAIVEVWIHAKYQPLEEPFQTIAACEAYDLYKFWTSHNRLWRWSIRRYYSHLDGEWRGEPELTEHIIKYIETKI
jgi:hypothetical protein